MMAVVPSLSAAELLARGPIVPVVVLEDPDQAVGLGEALLTGGIDVVEITLRTPAGLEGIRRLTRALPEMLVAAGSVLHPGHVDAVADAGARAVVSPGTSPAVLDRAAHHGLPALPGVATASDLMVVTARGVDAVKLFPAHLLGGPAAVRALSAPFPGMSFMPSGGVSPENLSDYLRLDAVPAVSGSWMVEPRLLADGDLPEVTRRAGAACDRARAG